MQNNRRTSMDWGIEINKLKHQRGTRIILTPSEAQEMAAHYGVTVRTLKSNASNYGLRILIKELPSLYSNIRTVKVTPELISEVSDLFYNKQLKESEIAKQLKVSIRVVSRCLKFKEQNYSIDIKYEGSWCVPYSFVPKSEAFSDENKYGTPSYNYNEVKFEDNRQYKTQTALHIKSRKKTLE